MGILAFVVAVVTLLPVYIWWGRPRLRRVRIERQAGLLRPPVDLEPPIIDDADLEELRATLARAFAIADAGKRADERVRGLYIPIAGPEQSEASTIESIAKALADDRVGVAIAGGEQLAQNLADMALPGALENIAEHAYHGALASMHDQLLSHGKDAVVEHLFHGGIAHGFVSKAFEETFAAGSVGAAHEVLGNLGESFDPHLASGFHFPWVTALTSAAREARLISEDKTTLGRSLQNVAIETGSTAMGIAAGAKAGAILGSVFPGIGTGIGAILGATLGGMKGRAVGAQIKRAPLERAVAQYRSVASRLESRQASSTEGLVHAVSERAVAARCVMERAVLGRPTWVWSPADLATFRELLAALRDRAAERARQVERTMRERQAAVAKDRWYHMLLGISVQDELQARIEDVHAARRAAALAMVNQIETCDRQLVDPLGSIVELLTIRLGRGPRIDAALARIRERFESQCDAVVVRTREWMERTTSCYRHQLRAVCTVAVAEAGRHRAVLMEVSTELAGARAVVERERDALGL